MNHANGEGTALHDIEHFFKTYLHDKSPFHLPPHVREWIVRFGPWIDLVLLVLALPVIVAAIGLSLFFLPFAAIAHPFGTIGGIVHWVVILATFILEIVALPGLFRRSLSSWYLLYYAALITGVMQLLSMDILGAVIGTAISLFILFEIKTYYH